MTSLRSFCGAGLLYFFIARRIQPFLSLVDSEVGFWIHIHKLIVLQSFFSVFFSDHRRFQLVMQHVLLLYSSISPLLSVPAGNTPFRA